MRLFLLVPAIVIMCGAEHVEPNTIVASVNLDPVTYASPSECNQKIITWYIQKLNEIKQTSGDVILNPPSVLDGFSQSLIMYTKRDEPGFFRKIMITCVGSMQWILIQKITGK